MTREMQDGINTDAAGMDHSIALVAYYIDGLYAWTQAQIDLFPNSVHVRIAVRWTTRDGHVIDRENGDATPEQAAAWAHQRRLDGYPWPAVYCSESNQQAVIDAFNAIHEPMPLWWLAHYDNVDVLPAGCIAKQYADPGPLDRSVVADRWPGVDNPGGNVSGPVDLTAAATNAVWMQMCLVSWPKGSANALAAIGQGATPNADGSVTEVHPAAVWLTVMAGREALDQTELAALQSGLSALQTSTAQVDADVKNGIAGVAGQLTDVAAAVAALKAAALPAVTGTYQVGGSLTISQPTPPA
jgi:hypothetical protein